MNRTSMTIICGVGVALLVACAEKKPSTTIITKKPVEKVVPKETQRMGDYEQDFDVAWIESTYKVIVSRKADESLPVVDDGNGVKFYDNKVTVRVVRQDGTEFFNRVYSKKDFARWVEEPYLENSVLLGVVFDRAEGDDLYFVASVGTPDVLSDEYVPMAIKLNRMGTVSISKETRLDSSIAAESHEDEGV